MKHFFNFPERTRKLGLTFAVAVLPLTLLVACGQNSDSGSSPAPNSSNPPGSTTPGAAQGAVAPVVVKSTATIYVSGNVSGQPAQMDAATVPSKTIPISVVNAPNTSMTVDTTNFKVPTITNSVLSFGSLKITSLIDNNLQVCGTSGASVCNNAVIRIYTTGTAGAGLYNTDGGYGMPISATLSGKLAMIVGLNASAASVIQTVVIPITQHALHLTDFKPAPSYSISSDFTNAGTGAYSTTLVVEYGLSE